MAERRSGRRVTAVAGAALLGVAAGGWAACGGGEASVVVGGTTSTQDPGLLDSLLVWFGRERPEYDVKVVAVGSGEALELGRRGDFDVLLTHAPEAERAFMEAGHGRDRVPVMYNDFILVGPPEDPADARGTEEAADALGRIARAGAPFFSRGDDSGTHRRELDLWEGAGGRPPGDWYAETGQGQGETLQIASQRGGYALTDRPTFLVMRDGLRLEVLHEGDPALINVYSVMRPVAARNPAGGDAFSGWLTSEAGRRRIAAFGTGRYGEPLYIPLVVGENLPLSGPALAWLHDSLGSRP